MEIARSSLEVFTAVLLSTLFFTFSSAESIFVSDNAAAEKGADVQITCQLKPNPSNIYIYRTASPSISGSNHLSICYQTDCLSHGFYNRYNTTSDGQNVYINIRGLERYEDQRYWTCTSGDRSAQLFLTVYTSPTAAVLTSSAVRLHSLVNGPLTLTCKTDRCTYKDPVFIWYIMMGNGSQQVFSLGKETLSGTAASCSNPEALYYSALNLQANMTFPGNIDITVRFVCAISFPTLADELLSSPSNDVVFAVKVTRVHFYDGNQEKTDSDQVIVTENVQHSITCKPGSSRPPPIYAFYIETANLFESKNNSLTFTPARHQHGMKIYCKAYNLQGPDNAVISPTPQLFVRVPVASVVLKDGAFEPDSCSAINATEESQKTLTCVAGVSRPSPVYVWYIDCQARQNHTGSTFMFMPQMNDHERRVYCTAQNLEGYQPVTSFNPKLHVIGRPIPPRTFIFTGSRGTTATFYWVAGYNGGFRQRFILQYRKLDSNDWTNVTEAGEVMTTNEFNAPLDEYKTQINLAPGEYQARLIAGNIKGEAIPVSVLGSTFQTVIPDVGESSSSQPSSQTSTQTSTTTTVIGAVLGTMNVVLLGIIVFQCFWWQRKQKRDAFKTTFKLEEIPKSQITSGDTYEELGPTTEAARSTYDTLESKTMPPTNPFSQEYENTTVG